MSSNWVNVDFSPISDFNSDLFLYPQADTSTSLKLPIANPDSPPFKIKNNIQTVADSNSSNFLHSNSSASVSTNYFNDYDDNILLNDSPSFQKISCFSPPLNSNHALESTPNDFFSSTPLSPKLDPIDNLVDIPKDDSCLDILKPLVWLPARVHPELSPGQYSEWINKYGSHIRTLECSTKRRNSILGSRKSSISDPKEGNSFPSSDSSLEAKDLFLATGGMIRQPNNIPYMINVDRESSLKRSKLVNKRRDSRSQRHGHQTKNQDKQSSNLSEVFPASSSTSKKLKSPILEPKNSISNTLLDNKSSDADFSAISSPVIGKSDKSATIEVPAEKPSNNISKVSSDKASKLKPKDPVKKTDSIKKKKKLFQNGIHFFGIGKKSSNDKASSKQSDDISRLDTTSRDLDSSTDPSPFDQDPECLSVQSDQAPFNKHNMPSILTPVRPDPSTNTKTIGASISPIKPIVRYPLHVERAIYQLAGIKLSDPKRPLHQQVLLSNMMYWYFDLINPFKPSLTQPPVGNNTNHNDLDDDGHNYTGSDYTRNGPSSSMYSYSSESYSENNFSDENNYNYDMPNSENRGEINLPQNPQSTTLISPIIDSRIGGYDYITDDSLESDESITAAIISNNDLIEPNTTNSSESAQTQKSKSVSDTSISSTETVSDHHIADIFPHTKSKKNNNKYGIGIFSWNKSKKPDKKSSSVSVASLPPEIRSSLGYNFSSANGSNVTLAKVLPSGSILNGNNEDDDDDDDDIPLVLYQTSRNTPSFYV
ncbi:Protein zds1 [Smittium mucronatum]|uniref:Protein zds1 n=1 Tax=Smittium mucronatum TaxID=133383 RepID=A0A1R0GT15_9FUNG|nr:Protein zds1 [Smittium mucronatum]